MNEPEDHPQFRFNPEFSDVPWPDILHFHFNPRPRGAGRAGEREESCSMHSMTPARVSLTQSVVRPLTPHLSWMHDTSIIAIADVNAARASPGFFFLLFLPLTTTLHFDDSKTFALCSVCRLWGCVVCGLLPAFLPCDRGDRNSWREWTTCRAIERNGEKKTITIAITDRDPPRLDDARRNNHRIVTSTVPPKSQSSDGR